jgi:hypothetical protein
MEYRVISHQPTYTQQQQKQKQQASSATSASWLASRKEVVLSAWQHYFLIYAACKKCSVASSELYQATLLFA